MNFILPKLRYNYNDLEPYFDEETMNIHHTKHHQTYINNANNILKNFLPEFSKLSGEDLLKRLNQFPSNERNILRNNVGGHINHSFFWKNLKKDTILSGNLKNAIINNFGSIDAFKLKFKNVAESCFGSGWTWLVKQNDKLLIVSTKNQDNPIMGIEISGTFGTPILGLDIWEHAYYLKYKNKRSDYILSFWNVVNWDEALIQFNKI